MTFTRHFALILYTAACLSLLLLPGCAIQADVIGVEQSDEGGAIGPQRIDAATEVVKFDPAAIPLGDGRAAGGDCRASAVVGGALRCDLETGEATEPCFITSGERLICGPNPVAGTYAHLVSPGSPLPSVPPPPPDRVVRFFVELDNGLTCVIRTGPEPVIIGGTAALYDCSEPYTYLLDAGDKTLDFSAPIWTTIVTTLDPTTGESLGGAPANIARVWIP